ncbi:MAG: hypothetical protein MPK06_05620 [Alphaproteobacteria bacterium]|nr:hypothetical protein [Alphaproteobacteria bacterium]MDA8004221.1 hypothetical protein [Alphaproteobacteria bacterium]MDA8005999.1 hypothetical protein [Alphaproteobacteria bacterium]MDA8013372.1 hypothetical protein [Alphaproteobacteria bacterium]
MKIPFSFISSVAVILAVAIGSGLGGARTEANAQSQHNVYLGTGVATVPGGSVSGTSNGNTVSCPIDYSGVPPIILGFRSAEFGVEATYAQTDVDYKSPCRGSDEARFFALDAVFFRPLGEGNVDLLIAPGSYSASSRVVSGPFSATYSETDFRLGAGLQFNLSERFAIRGLGRYYLGDALDGLSYEMGFLVKF